MAARCVMKASSKHNHLNATTPRLRLDRDHCVGHVFLSAVYMPTMNYSYLYLTELRPIEKVCKFQHFVTERVIHVAHQYNNYERSEVLHSTYTVELVWLWLLYCNVLKCRSCMLATIVQASLLSIPRERQSQLLTNE